MTQKEKEIALALATDQFVSRLKSLGVESYVIGLALGDKPDSDGLTLFGGRSVLVLNLVAGLIHGLTPGDFHSLLATMMASDYFAEHRGENVKLISVTPTEEPVQGITEDKKGWVN